MKRWLIAGLFLTGVAVVAVATTDAQPPRGKGGQKGPSGDDNGAPGGPPRFQLGRVLPPFARDELDLTPDQEAQIEALEKQVKAKLEKILTAEQRRKLKSIRPPGGPGGPGGPDGDEDRPQRGKGRPPGPPPGGTDGDDDRPQRGKGRPDGPPPGKDRPGNDRQQKGDDREAAAAGGIQWFTTWNDGKAEAARTGRPILLVSAAPHCAGVSGIW